MRRPHLRLVCVALVALLTGACGPAPPGVYREQLFAFGTLIDISLYGVEPQAARAAIAAVDALFQRQNRDWHAWQKGELDSLNQAIATGGTFQPDASILRLIGLAQRFERLSQGLFNPAIGHLLNLWGFQKDEPGPAPPDPTAVEHWLRAAPSTLQLRVDNGRVSSSNRAVKLDFGGFAKGYSVASAVELLTRRGIGNLIVNAGGDLCLRGRHGDRPWRIGIRSPDGKGVLASVDLEGAACVFTSGDYERYFVYQGKRYTHILDPRTGEPARGVHSVTVIADEAALADAAATALFVAGTPQWREIARNMSVREVLLMDADGGAHVTATLKPLLHFERPPAAIETVDLEGPTRH